MAHDKYRESPRPKKPGHPGSLGEGYPPVKINISVKFADNYAVL
jgi:hypothetical protein